MTHRAMNGMPSVTTKGAAKMYTKPETARATRLEAEKVGADMAKAP
jgi:hypothetical protein